MRSSFSQAVRDPALLDVRFYFHRGNAKHERRLPHEPGVSARIARTPQRAQGPYLHVHAASEAGLGRDRRPLHGALLPRRRCCQPTGPEARMVRRRGGEIGASARPQRECAARGPRRRPGQRRRKRRRDNHGLAHRVRVAAED